MKNDYIKVLIYSDCEENLIEINKIDKNLQLQEKQKLFIRLIDEMFMYIDDEMKLDVMLSNILSDFCEVSYTEESICNKCESTNVYREFKVLKNVEKII